MMKNCIPKLLPSLNQSFRTGSASALLHRNPKITWGSAVTIDSAGHPDQALALDKYAAAHHEYDFIKLRPMTTVVNANLPEKLMHAREGRDNQQYNPETGARMVAGCVCLNEDRTKCIMISLLAYKGKWVLPKGGIESDESEDYVITAVRETWEEAGVEGKITAKLPVVLDSRLDAPVIKGDFDPTVKVPKLEFHFYEMVVDQLATEWPEQNKRERRWCSYDEAKHELKRAKRPELLEVLTASSILK